jgi:hypothetical protein
MIGLKKDVLYNCTTQIHRKNEKWVMFKKKSKQN